MAGTITERFMYSVSLPIYLGQKKLLIMRPAPIPKIMEPEDPPRGVESKIIICKIKNEKPNTITCQKPFLSSFSLQFIANRIVPKSTEPRTEKI